MLIRVKKTIEYLHIANNVLTLSCLTMIERPPNSEFKKKVCLHTFNLLLMFPSQFSVEKGMRKTNIDSNDESNILG